MAAFHVFVEGPTDDSEAGLSRLASAISLHYGLPAADLLARLQRGRFRVKGNIDRATAETYVSDLQLLGARCTIEEATADNSQRTTPIPFPAVRPGTPAPVADAPRAAGRPSTPPAGTAALPPRASTPPPVASALPPRASTPPPVSSNAQQFQSGLSAAFSGEMPAADLGALGSGDAAFSLASLDGVEDGSNKTGGTFDPPAGGIPASIGPAPEKPAGKAGGAKADKKDKPKDEPLDMFAPPEMQGEEFKVNIAAEEEEFSARKRASTPPPMDETPAGGKPTSGRIPTAPATRKSQPSLQVPNTPAAARKSSPSIPVQNAPVDGVVAKSTSKLGPLADERNRFVVGVFLAVLIGFAPAHFVAKAKEESSFQSVDAKIVAAQQAAIDTPDLYAGLDRLRADQLSRKESERRNAALIAFAVWALVGSAIAFAWFKKIPWDSLE